MRLLATLALAVLVWADPAAAGRDTLVIGDGLRDVLDPRTRAA